MVATINPWAIIVVVPAGVATPGVPRPLPPPGIGNRASPGIPRIPRVIDDDRRVPGRIVVVESDGRPAVFTPFVVCTAGVGDRDGILRKDIGRVVICGIFLLIRRIPIWFIIRRQLSIAALKEYETPGEQEGRHNGLFHGHSLSVDSMASIPVPWFIPPTA
jgi:hypothetical protein